MVERQRQMIATYYSAYLHYHSAGEEKRARHAYEKAQELAASLVTSGKLTPEDVAVTIARVIAVAQ